MSAKLGLIKRYTDYSEPNIQLTNCT